MFKLFRIIDTVKYTYMMGYIYYSYTYSYVDIATVLSESDWLLNIFKVNCVDNNW